MPLPARSPIVGSTRGATRDVSLRCTGSSNAGPDVVYSTQVPAGQRLVVSVEPVRSVNGLSFDPSLSLVATPAGNCADPDAGELRACLGGRDERGADVVSWFNDSAAPRDAFLVIGSFLRADDVTAGVSFEGDFTLRWAFEAPGAGDRCDDAPRLSPAGTRTESLAGFGPDFARGTGCAPQAGADRAFLLEVPRGQRLTATATPVTRDGGLDVVLNLIAGPAANCRASPPVCLANADRGVRDQPDSLTWVNDEASDRSVFLVVGSAFADTAETAFTLTTSTQTPPPSDTCATATPLTPGTSLMAEPMAGFDDDLTFGPGCAATGLFDTATDRVFSLSVPVGKRLTATVTPSAGLDTLLSLVDVARGCSPLVCLAGDAAPRSPEGQQDTVSFTNRSSAPTSLLLVVDSRAGTTGTFDLTTTLSDPPPGDFCDIAAPLLPGTPVTGTTVGATNDYENDLDDCAPGTGGPDVAYSLELPSGQRTRFTVTPLLADAGFNPSLNLVLAPSATCEAVPRRCFAGVGAASQGSGPRVVTTFNGQATPQPVFAIVDGTTAGPFSLSVTSEPARADDVCSTAITTLTPGSTLVAQSLNGFERDSDCVARASGVDRVYRVTAPAAQRLSVSITPTPALDGGTFDPVVALVEGPAPSCDGPSRRCLAVADVGAQRESETVTLANPGGARPVFLVVSSYDAAAVDSTFSVTAATSPIASFDLCENAQPIAATTSPAVSGSTMGLARDYALAGAVGCSSAAGADVVYALSFSTAVTVTVTPDRASDVVLNLLDGPASTCATATRCLSSADLGGVGAAESLSVTSTTLSSRTVYLLVSRASPGPMTFSLNAVIP